MSDMQTRSAGPTALSFRDVSMTFDGVVALSGIQFDVASSSIHALLGANGAGKSTLIKILAGFYKADSGEILVAGESHLKSSAVAFIHQDLALVPDLTVAENIALLNGYPRRRGAISWKKVRTQAKEIMSAVAEEIDVDAKVSELSRADQSLVAIARAVSLNARTIVLDEPTASLPDADVDRLFEILLKLKSGGVSILYVSHRLDEIRRISDHVTVLRDGRVIVDDDIDSVTDQDIVSAIVGGAVVNPVRLRSLKGSPVVLGVRGAQVTEDSGPLEFDIHRGEILGLAGLRGAGHELVGRAVAGVEPIARAEFLMSGHPVQLSTVRQAIAHGVGFATSRREQEALAMTLSARENIFLNPGAAKPRYRPRLLARAERNNAAQIVGDVKLRPADPEAIVATFSGGNQQKVVLGRWLSVELALLVLEEPTMGIDVGARAEIYTLIHGLADEGLAALLVSSDFEELVTVCDRVLVFDRGVIHAELSGTDLTLDNITQLASGAAEKVEAP
ncbi:MAG: sugar transporter ATP-binding protein [Microbacteriaceae bacterium]|nr:sugar transporter ATP-binding protein [Microbacteriaceae bacterium]